MIWCIYIFLEDESEFDYLKESEKGPHRWGELKEEWAACKHGKLQSPIDLASERVTVVRKLEKLRIKYKPANATIKNRGHDISVRLLRFYLYLYLSNEYKSE